MNGAIKVGRSCAESYSSKIQWNENNTTKFLQNIILDRAATATSHPSCQHLYDKIFWTIMKFYELFQLSWMPEMWIENFILRPSNYVSVYYSTIVIKRRPGDWTAFLCINILWYVKYFATKRGNIFCQN